MGTSVRPQLDDEDAMIDRMVAAGATDEEIISILQEMRAERQPSAIYRFMRGIGTGAKAAMGKLASPGVMGPGVRPSITREQIQREQQQFEARRPTPEQLGTAGKVGEFVGEIAATTPLASATGGLFGGLARTPVEKIVGSAASAPTKISAFLRGAAAGAPSQVAAGAATSALLDPASVATPESALRTAGYSLLGSVFDGAFGVVARNSAEKTAKLAQLAAEAKVDPEKMKELISKIDVFTDQFDKLLKDPLSPAPAKGVQIPDTFTPREWAPNPKGARIPNSVDVQGYAEEISADLLQRRNIQQRMIEILDRLKRGVHTEGDIVALVKQQGDFDALSIKIGEDMRKLGASAENVRGLFSFSDDITLSSDQVRTNVFKALRQDKPNLVNPFGPNPIEPKFEELKPRVETFKVRPGREILPPKVTEPGSGQQSAYPFVEPTPEVDPLAPAVNPKVESTGNQFLGLSPAQQKMAEKIDFGNENLSKMLEGKRYLLDTWWKRFDYRAFDFLRPLREVDEKVDELAGKFLHLSLKQQAAVNDAIYIPDGQGGYTRGAESLLPIAKALGGDANSLFKFQLYAHARQTTSGIETPFDPEAAFTTVQELEREFPKFKQVFDDMYMPMVADLVKMMGAYDLVSQKSLEKMLKNPEYVPLFRSVFAGESTSLRRRRNPSGQLATEDFWQASIDNIAGIVRAGERVQVLRELAKARMAKPELAGMIEFVEHKLPEGYEEAMGALPKDIPEEIKDMLAYAFARQAKGNLYSFWMDGKRVTMKVNDEIKSSLNMMQYNFPKVYQPENVGQVEKFLATPLKSTANVEKTATSLFSVYRDLFGFGVPLDAAEVMVNASAKGQKFNMLTDPVRGFFALYRGDPLFKDLAAHSGGLGFRYANPMAEEGARSAQELMKLASASGIKLRIINPKQALIEFAGNLSNASRAGYVMRNRDGRSMQELATMYNNILGDPARSGAALGALAKFTGFLNYPLQATKAQIKALANSPQNLAFFLARAGGMLVAPTLAFKYLTKDNEAASQMSRDPNGRRFMFMDNPFDERELLAIPKPQGPAGVLFVTLPDMLMEELKDSGNTEMFEQVGKAAIQSLLPNFLPLTWNYAQSLATGKSINLSSLSAVDVVPQSQQQLLPEDAGAAGTLNTSRALANMTGIDAGKWDKLMRTLLIGTSYDIAQNIDFVMGDKKGPPPRPSPLGTIPGLRRVEKSTAGSRYINEFYDIYEGSKKALNSINSAINTGQASRAADIAAENMDMMKKAIELDAYYSTMQNLNENIKITRNNEYTTAEDKRKELDRLYATRIQIAKEAVQFSKRPIQ